jgi:hypothetical protein
MIEVLEYLAAGGVFGLFALLTYGGFLIAKDEEQRYRDRRNGRKNDERNKR